MALFKCKMCGGTLEIGNRETVATCEYCGTQQTLPRLDDDRRANLYDRANHFRRNNEFDKAMGIYEQILNEDNGDAEAYWSLVLCRYGIEYVEDPASHKRMPTVNRAQFTSIFDDDNYKSALRYADGYQRSIYEEEARAINAIQKEILAISQKEEPFDVFICYKETDKNGRRTPDSVLATELYHQLTQEGFRVFFSRITLEDKLGSAYEPYIFAALNSAKVMVVLGTRQEYFQAAWVKNEWSRYLALIRQGQKKVLIPAYRDMDPYDLPEEFSHLQAQDMSKLGFMQDLIRGIGKLAAPQAPVYSQPVSIAPQTAPLLKRAFMFLEDGDWHSADEYCEKVLDADPENAMAYVGKLMALLQVRSREALKTLAKPFDTVNHYQKAIRFADPALKNELIGYNDAVLHRIEQARIEKENARKESIYRDAKNYFDRAITIKDLQSAEKFFRSIADYKDAGLLAEQCLQRVENLNKDYILEQAKVKVKIKIFDVNILKMTIRSLESISGYKDADAQLALYKQKLAELEAKEEANRIEQARQAQLAREKAAARKKTAKKVTLIAVATLCVILACILIYTLAIRPGIQYQAAQELMEAGKYTEAISAFEALGGFKDSAGKITECNTAILDGKYSDASTLMEAGNYADAISAFEALDGFKDSLEQINQCWYQIALSLMDTERYAEAISAFEALGGYKDSAEKITECNTAILDGKYNDAIALMDAGKYSEAAMAFGAAGNHKDAKAQAKALWDRIAVRNTIAAGSLHTVGLKADGTVVAVGNKASNQCKVSGWKNIVAIAAGNLHTVGLKVGGTVVAIGSNYQGQCNTSGWKNIVAIAAAGSHTVGLKADGTVVAIGLNYHGQCNTSGWKNIVAVAAGGDHTVGLQADGTVVAVGDNDFSQCNTSGWKNIIAIAAGGSHTVGLKADGTVVAIGSNSDGQCKVSGWRNIVAIAAGDSYTVGLKADGAVVAIGSNSDGQCKVSGWRNIVAITAGSSHTIGLKANGTVVAVGNNKLNQCKVSGWKDIRLPEQK